MRIKTSALLLLSFLALSGLANGTTVVPRRAYYQPLSGTNAYILSGTNASRIVNICGADENVFIKHWQPSKDQVYAIDKKLNLKLENVDDRIGLYNIFKLYFGLEDDKRKKYVYTFIFPKSKDNGITLNFWDDSLVCPNLKLIAEFSLEKLELRMLKPDITNAFNGWSIRTDDN